jgi:phage tail protein X
MTIYTTVDGDVLDLIAHRHYGRTNGVLERVLARNRHLENYDAILPNGVRIMLPVIPNPKNNQKIKIWQ